MGLDKVIRDGKVAVLYSPGFGAGWFSWNPDHPDLLYDPDIVAAVEAGDREMAAEIAGRKHPDVYTGGACDLEIEWLPVGTQFKIDEYDGSERVVVSQEVDWHSA